MSLGASKTINVNVKWFLPTGWGARIGGGRNFMSAKNRNLRGISLSSSHGCLITLRTIRPLILEILKLLKLVSQALQILPYEYRVCKHIFLKDAGFGGTEVLQDTGLAKRVSEIIAGPTQNLSFGEQVGLGGGRSAAVSVHLPSWKQGSQAGRRDGCTGPDPQDWSFKSGSFTCQSIHFLFPLNWVMFLSLQPKESWLIKGVFELLIHKQLFNKCLLSTYHAPGPAVSTRNVSGNKAGLFPVLLNLLKYRLIGWINLKYYFYMLIIAQ